MVKTKEKIFIILVFAVLFISIISANFYVGEPSHSIDTEYALSDYITGWINISLDDEPANSIFETSEGDEITLVKLLDLNDADYDCIPADCGTNYEAYDTATTKEFILNEGNSTIIGLKLSGGIINDVSRFSMKVKSDAGISNKQGLFIDILNNGEVNWWSHTASSGSFGIENFGCYNISDETDAIAEITQREYCEKITLYPAPEVEIGANITEAQGGGEVDFTMRIYDSISWEYFSCNAPASEAGRVNCTPSDFGVAEKQDFFVCISTNTAGANKYGLHYETKDVCGFSGNFAGEYSFDFKIFARPTRYSAIGSFTLNNTEIENLGSYIELENYIEEYLFEKYDGDCTSDCIVPIKFTSELNQQTINISDIALSYTTGISTTTNEIYNLTETPAKISSDDFLQLYLDDANFSVPDSYGEESFSLEFDNHDVFTEELYIEKFPVIEYLTPTTTAAALPTKFTVNVKSPDPNISIIKYEWNFGNDDIIETTTNSITYTYYSIGEYELKISVTDSEGLSYSKTFNIIVESPAEAVNKTLEEKLRNLENVKSKIDELPLFYQLSLKPILDLTTNEDGLQEIKLVYDSMTEETPEEEYIELMKSLIEIEIPSSIDMYTSAESLLFYPYESEVELDILQAIGGGSYDSNYETRYINSVLAWHVGNIESRISLNEVSASYGGFKEPVLKVFELKINKKSVLDYDSYLILQKLDNLKFKEDYLEKEESGYIYIELEESQKTIVFSTTEDINFFDLPAFISPALSDLSLIENGYDEENGEEDKWKSMLPVLIIILVVLVGAVVYIIWQAWRDKKYGKRRVGRKPGIIESLTEKLLSKTKKRPEQGRYPLPLRRYPKKRFYRY